MNPPLSLLAIDISCKPTFAFNRRNARCTCIPNAIDKIVGNRAAVPTRCFRSVVAATAGLTGRQQRRVMASLNKKPGEREQAPHPAFRDVKMFRSRCSVRHCRISSCLAGRFERRDRHRSDARRQRAVAASVHARTGTTSTQIGQMPKIAGRRRRRRSSGDQDQRARRAAPTQAVQTKIAGRCEIRAAVAEAIATPSRRETYRRRSAADSESRADPAERRHSPARRSSPSSPAARSRSVSRRCRSRVGEVLTKWSGVEARIRAENEILARCRDERGACPAAAQNFPRHRCARPRANRPRPHRRDQPRRQSGDPSR